MRRSVEVEMGRRALGLAAAIVAVGAAIAGAATPWSEAELRRADFVELWRGPAQILSCAGPDDRHRLGDYVFICNGRRMEHPVHFGEAALWARVLRNEGWEYLIAYICLDGRRACIRGGLRRAR